MSWEYAELSKAASKAGGVSKYVDTLVESGKSAGRMQVYPFVLLAIPVGMGIEWAIFILQSLRMRGI